MHPIPSTSRCRSRRCWPRNEPGSETVQGTERFAHSESMIRARDGDAPRRRPVGYLRRPRGRVRRSRWRRDAARRRRGCTGLSLS
ncbi:hypothetical protein RHCRD62_90192 [Rhodococcus sp. RD6.2]|nr:hypothetical protein RHCRD62_90192 [Rhodococcus sp. RD6.2]